MILLYDRIRGGVTMEYRYKGRTKITYPEILRSREDTLKAHAALLVNKGREANATGPVCGKERGKEEVVDRAGRGRGGW
jgi:hypothetical protein